VLLTQKTTKIRYEKLANQQLPQRDIFVFLVILGKKPFESFLCFKLQKLCGGAMAAGKELETVNVLMGVCFKASIIVILAILTLLACIVVHRLQVDLPVVITESNPIANSITCPDGSNPFFAGSIFCETSITGQQCNFSNCDNQDEYVSMANICICHK